MKIELKATPGATIVHIQEPNIIALVTEVRILSPDFVLYRCQYFWDGVCRSAWLAAEQFAYHGVMGNPKVEEGAR
jgi:hypothetical protein